MIEERHKRALPARHTFLTDAVSSVLESQSKAKVPQIDCRTILKLDQDTTLCQIHYESAQASTIPTTDIPQPIFRILPQRRPIKNKNSLALSDDYYLARHRKHEMEEKKQKNREKERLEHELYQQKQQVERLKTMDKSTLASIVSSLRSTNNDTPNYTPAELDRLHQTLLEEAREQLHRYERLGLGRKRGQGFTVTDHAMSPPSTTTTITTITAAAATAATATAAAISPEEPIILRHAKTPIKTTSPTVPSSTFRPTGKSTKESKVLAHFQSHGHRSVGGKRKSLRTAIAFGEKIPTMDDTEFMLPLDVFGTMMIERRSRMSL